MKLLCGDAFAPITSEIGFLEADIATAVDVFVRWQTRIMAPLGVRVGERPVAGSLSDVFRTLLPLTGPRPRRYLFLPTDSTWLGIFDNSSSGTDAFSVPSYLASEIACRALRIGAVPDTLKDGASRGRYGALAFELFGPEGGPLGHIRSITLINDGGKWVFEHFGAPLPFEHAQKYGLRKMAERFTFDDLREYAAAIGIRPFDPDFYRPSGARLVELSGAKPKGMHEYTLEEVRMAFGEVG